MKVLSKREREVLEMFCEGLEVKEIAARLNLSFRTVEFYRCRLYLKMQMPYRANRVLLFRKAIQDGYVQPLSCGIQ